MKMNDETAELVLCSYYFMYTVFQSYHLDFNLRVYFL